jgi:hypothetical protein
MLILLGTTLTLGAQVTAKPGQSTPGESKVVEAVPRVPGVGMRFSGFNAGVTYSAVHNSSVGWYTVLTPAVNYTFSRHLSGDVSTSLYFHRLIQNTNPVTAGTRYLVVDEASAGDTLIGLHATFLPRELLNTVSLYLTAPSGDRSSGVGTGRMTLDLSNHTECYYKRVGFLLDLGGGNSSNVFNNLVMRNYSSVGKLMHFQSGVLVWLPAHAYLESAAYEQLPVGGQTIYSSVDLQNAPLPPPIMAGTFAEDNGFINYVGVPLTDHLTLSGYYDRSLRRHSDTVSFGVTYVLRGNRWKKSLSLIDRALREAETSTP